MEPTNHTSATQQISSFNHNLTTLNINTTIIRPFTIAPTSNQISFQDLAFGTIGIFLTLATIWIGLLQLLLAHKHHQEQKRCEQERNNIEMQYSA
jgi:hypothetical protein